MTFLQWFGLCTLGMWAATWLLYRAAERGPRDNFGAGFLVWLAGIIALAMTVIWIIVAGIKAASGF